jgi:DNA-directed RNA polymerase, mitochondrial
MFSAAHEIQEWLKECARRITKSQGPKDFLNKSPTKALPYLSSVVWTTPLSLPVCQPYRKMEMKVIRTIMTHIYLRNPNTVGPVDPRKQTNAFPPNFIHSLDASHMLMSAIACDQAGLTFAAVHDSFWTHACDVDVMNIVLREAFVRMHQVDLIEKLRDEFVERYKGHYILKECLEHEKVERKKGQHLQNSKDGWQPLVFPPIPKKV